MTIPNRAPNSVWCLSREECEIFVATEVNEEVRVVGPDFDGRPEALFLSRQQARLLAKRINECLDATVKR